MDHRNLVDLAATQRGLFTWKQARAAGYSAWQISRRLDDGQWRRVLGPTLAAGQIDATPELHDLAAYLAAGEPTVLSGPSAARLFQMPVPDCAPCITLPRSRHLTLPTVTQLRGQLKQNEVIVVDGILVTTKGRTAVDCLRLLPYEDALAFLHRSLQQRWTTAEALAVRASGHERFRGHAQLRQLAREALAGAHSEAERLAGRLLREADITGWVPNLEVRLAGQLAAVIDIAFPAVRLAVELDGRSWHVDRDRFQRDRVRQNALVNAGWTVLRFNWDDLTMEPIRVVAEIRAALGRLAA